jgi:ATP-dependent DNA helicase DinG
VSERSRTFFTRLGVTFGPRSGQSEQRARYVAESIGEHFEDGMMLAGALEGLEASLALAPRPPEGDEAMDVLQRRAGELRTDLRFLMRASEAEFVYYLDVRGRGIYLRASPIDVSRIIQEALFARIRTAVLTSATLAVDGSFEYLRGRLGVRHADELRVASEFDYGRQALLYLPRQMPPPKAPSFAEAAARQVVELVRPVQRPRLRPVHQLRRAADRPTGREMSLPYPILVQGTAPRSTLIERFRQRRTRCLLATSSFWQGVDVVGEALSCVIVDKLPFASPGDPITAARIEAINAAGGDAFSDYQVPLAALALQQGLGRLYPSPHGPGCSGRARSPVENHGLRAPLPGVPAGRAGDP